jgi:hypothetical protein
MTDDEVSQDLIRSVSGGSTYLLLHAENTSGKLPTDCNILCAAMEVDKSKLEELLKLSKRVLKQSLRNSVDFGLSTCSVSFMAGDSEIDWYEAQDELVERVNRTKPVRLVPESALQFKRVSYIWPTNSEMVVDCWTGGVYWTAWDGASEETIQTHTLQVVTIKSLIKRLE